MLIVVLSVPIMLCVKPFAIYFSNSSHDYKAVSGAANDGDDNFIRTDNLMYGDPKDPFKIRESIIKSVGQLHS